MEELNKIKELFNDFIKETDKIMKKQRIEQTTEKTIYWGETAEEDIKQEEGRYWCEEKGGRLPTLEELEKAHKDGVSGFNYEGVYWTSTPNGIFSAYYVRFSDCYSGHNNNSVAYSVRCVYDK